VIQLSKIDKVFVPVVDFGHLNARNLGNQFASAQDYLNVFNKIEKELSIDIASNLHCHFSKIEFGDKGEKKHLTFDDKVYGPSYEEFVKAIAIGGYSPTVICESAGTQSRDALKMKQLYKEYINDEN
jgi:deoxyribonuclease-4